MLNSGAFLVVVVFIVVFIGLFCLTIALANGYTTYAMADDVIRGKWDNRSDFFRLCAEFTQAQSHAGNLKLEQNKVPLPWKCACAWNLSSMADFYGRAELGNMVLAVSEDSRYTRNTETITYVLGPRSEFNKYTTPAWALRVLAFYDMAKNDADVQNAGLRLSLRWHEQRRRYFNWQINLTTPVCEVSRNDSLVHGLNNATVEWVSAFHAISDAMMAQDKLMRHLRMKPLICSESVWTQFLLWYESNRKGIHVRELSPELRNAVQPLIGLPVEALPEHLDGPLAFLSNSPNAPIESVRVPAPNNEIAFRKWLEKYTSASQKSQSRYLQALSSLRKIVPELFETRDINSVFELDLVQDVESFIIDLKETEWCQNKLQRRPGVKRGGVDALVLLNHYCSFLKKGDEPIPDNTISMKGELILSLEELLQRADRVELLTGAKPVFIDCPWGRVENTLWRPLYKQIWEKAWAEKKEEIALHESLVTVKNDEAYLMSPKLYFTLDDNYVAYQNYGIRNMIPKLGKLFVACGVPLDKVQVCFIPQAESQQEEKKVVDLNTILYGPPGTGKTYHTMAYAVAICTGRNVDDVQQLPREEVERQYNDLLHSKDKPRIAFATFHQSYEYGDFIEGLAPEVKDGKVTYEVKQGVFRKFCEEVGDEPCVFIIDEINRGNISKIWGELMTLIEVSKRDKQEVVLPISGERFTVPKNVYILGTMNTADRSLAMMDTALRRRFDFVRMDPQPELLPTDVEGVNVCEMLRVMNKRICWLYDAEHTLGHALLWELTKQPTLEVLAAAFRKKIIPLLQEYFHDDDHKVRLVLDGCPLVTSTTLPPNLFRETYDDLPESLCSVLPVDAPAWLQPETYRTIYSRS